MYLETFINQHNNWQGILINGPYYFNIKQNNNYFIINYNQKLSNFNNPMTLEARGPIFRRESNGMWRCVCRSLDKIPNYNDSYAPKNNMNWRNGVDVQEKIDGSIIRIWYDNNEWHISTNNEINAFQVQCGNTTFGNLFLKILGLQDKNQLSNYFSQDWWFWFELVSPKYNHFVIQYDEDRIYYLGARSRINHMEITQSFGFKELEEKLHYPRHFVFYSLSQCIEAAKQLDDTQEGFVCISKRHENDSYLRIEVKGAGYSKLYDTKEKEVFNISRAVDLWKNNSLDKFSSNYPEYSAFINEIIAILNNLINAADIAYKVIANNKNIINNKENFLKYVNRYTFPLKEYLVERFENKVNNAVEYYKKLDNDSLITYLNTLIEENTICVKEDE